MRLITFEDLPVKLYNIWKKGYDKAIAKNKGEAEAEIAGWAEIKKAGYYPNNDGQWYRVDSSGVGAVWTRKMFEAIGLVGERAKYLFNKYVNEDNEDDEDDEKVKDKDDKDNKKDNKYNAGEQFVLTKEYFLPAEFDNLPSDAQRLFNSVINQELGGEQSMGVAIEKAWEEVLKAGWVNEEGKWVKKDVGDAVGEMYDYDSFEMSFAGEQDTFPKGVKRPNIPISPNVDLVDLTKGDNSKDKFIYAWTDSGISKNNRNWSSEIIESVARQVMEKLPVAYLGHLKPDQIGYAFFEPQIVWIGATTERINDFTTRLWLKGYVLPTSTKLKEWIKRKAVDSISIFGKINYERENGIDYVKFLDLKSIDISRKHGEGLNSGILGLAGEMDKGVLDDPEIKDKKDKEVNLEMPDRIEIIKSLTAAELKEHNPGLIGAIKDLVIGEIKDADKHKALQTAAGEMEKIVEVFGGEQEGIVDKVKQIKEFVGEMSSIFAGENATAAVLEPKQIIEKVKEIKQTNDNIVKLVKPAENQKVDEKVKEVIQENIIGKNKAMIEKVKNHLNNLLGKVNNEAAREFIQDEYEDIINVKPESITKATWDEETIKHIDDTFKNNYEKITKRLKKVMEMSQAAGEMSALENFGSGNVEEEKLDINSMSDEEYAEYLGY